MIRRHVALAREFAGWVADDPDFEVVAPVPFGLVCFRLAAARGGRRMSSTRSTRG